MDDHLVEGRDPVPVLGVRPGPGLQEGGQDPGLPGAAAVGQGGVPRTVRLVHPHPAHPAQQARETSLLHRQRDDQYSSTGM